MSSRIRKLELEIQGLDLEIATSRDTRGTLGNKIKKMPKENVESLQTSSSGEITKINPEVKITPTKLELLISELEETRLKLVNANPEEKLELQREITGLEKEIIKEPMNLSLWTSGQSVQARLKGFFTKEEMAEKQRIEKQKESYKQIDLDYETAPSTLDELNSLLQITIKNLGGSVNVEYLTEKGDKGVKIEVSGNSFGFIYMEFVDKPGNLLSMITRKTDGQRNLFEEKAVKFASSYSRDYPILANLLSKTFQNRVPNRFVLLGNASDKSTIGYCQSAINQNGGGGTIYDMNKKNDTFMIREVYREISILFGDEFGVKKLKSQKRLE